MPVEIIIPSPGESITEVTVGAWLKSSGQWVEKDEPLVEIESDKAALEVAAPESGVLTITAEQGAEMNAGDVIGTIDPDAKRPRKQTRKRRAQRPRRPSRSPPRSRSPPPPPRPPMTRPSTGGLRLWRAKSPRKRASTWKASAAPARRVASRNPM